MLSFLFLDKNRQNHDFDEKSDIISTTNSSCARLSSVARECGEQLDPIFEILHPPLGNGLGAERSCKRVAAGSITDPVDSVADSQKVASLAASTSAFFLQQSDDQRPSIVIIILVSVDHRDAVLRVRPERLCQRHQTTASYSTTTNYLKSRASLNVWVRIEFIIIISSSSSSSMYVCTRLQIQQLSYTAEIARVGGSGHFEGERVGTPFPLLKFPWNAWKRRSPC